MVATITLILNCIFDLFLFPLSAFPDYVSIAVLSLLSAIMLLFVFKGVTNQRAIRRQRDCIAGHILQILIYNDRLGNILSSIFAALKHNLYYLLHVLPALLVAIVPLFFITMQVNNRFGYEELDVGDRFIVQVRLKEECPEGFGEPELGCSKGLKLELGPLRIPSKRSFYWRFLVLPISFDAAECSSLAIEMDGVKGEEEGIKRHVARENGRSPSGRFAPYKVHPSSSSALLHHAEGFLVKGTRLESIRISYSRAAYSLFFWQVDAILLFLLLTIAIGFLLKGFVKVEI